MRNKNIGIDIMKFMAALLITNSHMDILYGSYSMLSTGGAIGDAAFFFISGFTLFLGSTPRFDNWYKKRINRIYPTVFAWAILSTIFFGSSKDMVDVVLYGGGWFVTCIMLFYPFFYLIKRFMQSYLVITFVIMSGVVLCAYVFWGYNNISLYNGASFFNFNWLLYFLFMLFGAIVGVRYDATKEEKFVKNFAFLVLFIILFYVIQYFCNRFVAIPQIKILSAVPLFYVILYFFRLFNTPFFQRVYSKEIIGFIIKAVGSLCLEIYIVQASLLTTKMNNLFPLNIVIMFLIIIFSAYILRCCSRWISQTFKDGEYDWVEIFKLT